MRKTACVGRAGSISAINILAPTSPKISCPANRLTIGHGPNVETSATSVRTIASRSVGFRQRQNCRFDRDVGGARNLELSSFVQQPTSPAGVEPAVKWEDDRCKCTCKLRSGRFQFESE